MPSETRRASLRALRTVRFHPQPPVDEALLGTEKDTLSYKLFLIYYTGYAGGVRRTLHNLLTSRACKAQNGNRRARPKRRL